MKKFLILGCALLFAVSCGTYYIAHEMSYPTYGNQFEYEEYQKITENDFLDVTSNPLSTFSIDVDAASYSNVRRFINNNQLPPKDAIRVEEMINYFSYDYPSPENDQPFSITTEMGVCPWESSHQLVHIGLKGQEIKTEDLPPSNIVFLLDVSGSMDMPNKLPLLKSGFRLLVDQLRKKDRVAIVTYAGYSGLALPPTPGDKKEKIIEAINNLRAGGSTAGAAGINTAYETAEENFIASGNNRVVLATDGDFNVGVSSDDALVELIEQKREKGIYLTVLGFGTGNLKDSKMEKLADKGNGNYAYIDNILEAKKVLVSEFGGTMYTIAKDVKLQIEFNPTKVSAYRLIGYENRLLKKEDFTDDTKDAGELGSGHTVTALYEVIPVGIESHQAKIDTLKYQAMGIKPEALIGNELMTIKFRYKKPHETESRLITQTVIEVNQTLDALSNNFRFSAAVAELGLLLRDSKFKGNASYQSALKLAKGAKGDDEAGYRGEFIRLVEACELLSKDFAKKDK